MRSPRCASHPTSASRFAAERAGSRLEQQPSAGAAERDQPQLLVAEIVRLGLRELAAGQHPHVETVLVEVLLQRRHARCDLLDRDLVVVADVGGRAHHRDAIVLRLARHRQAVLEAECAVVEFGQDVAVQIDHRPQST